MMIADNYKIVLEKVSDSCSKADRNVSEVSIIAVSKTNPLSAIREAYNAGLINFGENKAQELRDKNAECDLNVNWHFIGHLQTNKVKYVIEPAVLIHSVDSEKLAEEINKRAGNLNKVQRFLIEVNTSGEDAKFGLESEDDILRLLEYCGDLPNLEPAGLMTMAPYTDNEFVLRSCFSKLREFKDKLISRGHKLEELSMGMTNDFDYAIQEGATLVRIGTALFGQRNYAVKP